MNASGVLILAGFALALTAHFSPFQPASQVQVPFATLHVPWLQSGSSLHAQVLQSMPPKLALQLHHFVTFIRLLTIIIRNVLVSTF